MNETTTEPEDIDTIEVFSQSEANEEANIMMIWIVVALFEQIMCLRFLPKDFAGQEFLYGGTITALLITAIILVRALLFGLTKWVHAMKKYFLMALMLTTIWSGGIIGVMLMVNYLILPAQYGSFRTVASISIGCAMLFLAIIAVFQLKGFLPKPQTE